MAQSVSNDLGLNWSGWYTAEENLFSGNLIGPPLCYWGEYDGIVPDVRNETMLYHWGDMDTTMYRTRGMGVEP